MKTYLFSFLDLLTNTKALSLASVSSGAIGTLFLFFFSFSLEAPTVWMSKEMEDDIKSRNSRRAIGQRIGLALLLISFLVQGAALFLE